MKRAVSDFSEIKDNSYRFAEVIGKYCDIQELDEKILNELIDKIVVQERYFKDGQQHKGCRENRNLHAQQIDIHYNFVGII